jgi:hypothetical protein
MKGKFQPLQPLSLLDYEARRRLAAAKEFADHLLEAVGDGCFVIVRPALVAELGGNASRGAFGVTLADYTDVGLAWWTQLDTFKGCIKWLTPRFVHYGYISRYCGPVHSTGSQYDEPANWAHCPVDHLEFCRIIVNAGYTQIDHSAYGFGVIVYAKEMT